MKRLEFVKFKRALPPIKDIKKVESPPTPTPPPPPEVEINDVLSVLSSEEDEQIQLPIIETRVMTKKEEEPPLDTTKTTSLNKLRSLRKRKEQRVVKPFKPKPPPKSTTPKLPPLSETIKKQLKMALRRKRNAEIERPQPIKTPVTPRRKRAKKASREQSRRHKNKKTPSSSKAVTPTVDEIVIVEEVPVKEETNFLEVDLGTDHFVQQIVLEVYIISNLIQTSEITGFLRRQE